MNLKSYSVFIIIFIGFCMNQANSTQKCQKALSIIDSKQEVVFGSPPNKPLNIDKVTNWHTRQFLTAYNKGQFAGDERYIQRGIGLGDIIKIENYRITGLENGHLIVDRIDQTGSIISGGQISPEGIITQFRFSKQSKEAFQRIEQLPPLEEINFNSKNIEKLKEDKIGRLTFIGNGLRNSPRVNPYRTHIVDFEDQIIDHVEFIREGILPKGIDVNPQLTILDTLKHEAENKRDNKELTYQYWILWNMRLSILISSEKPSWNWKTHEGTLSWKEGDILAKNRQLNDSSQQSINNLLAEFPDYIALPSIGPFRYRDLNRSFSNNVFFIELENKNTFQDGLQMSPYEMYEHDLFHSVEGIFYTKRIDLPTMDRQQFSKRYLEIAETFPDEIREMAEIGHFIFFHEMRKFLKRRGSVKKFFKKMHNGPRSILTRLLDKENDLGSILPQDVQSDKEIKEYFERVIEVFQRIYLQILVDGYAQ